MRELRYFAGKATPTSAFSISSTDTPDATLGLPVATWTDPYALASGNARCAKPFQIVISDINPSYDSDQVPGSYFNSFTGDITGLDCQAEADDITANETDVPGLHFIGQSAATLRRRALTENRHQPGGYSRPVPGRANQERQLLCGQHRLFRPNTNDLNPVARRAEDGYLLRLPSLHPCHALRSRSTIKP